MGFVEAKKNGKQYRAEYVCEGNVITVFGDRGSRSTQLDAMSEQQAARHLLGHLIRESLIDPVDISD